MRRSNKFYIQLDYDFIISQVVEEARLETDKIKEENGKDKSSVCCNI